VIRAAISSAAAFRARSAFLGAAFGGVRAFSFAVDPAARTVFFGGGVLLVVNVLAAGGILFATTFRTTGPPDVRTAGGFLTGGTVPAPFATAGFATRGFATGGFGDGEFVTASFAIGAVTVGGVTVGGVTVGGVTVGGVTVAPGGCFVAIGDNIVGSASTAEIGFCRSAGSGVVVFAIG
jgi:hypothetical protein